MNPAPNRPAVSVPESATFMSQTRRHLRSLAAGLSILAAVLVAGPADSLLANATPEASPMASPVAGNGCAALGPYFLGIAELTSTNEGLLLLDAHAFDTLALTDPEATTVIAGLDELIASIEAIQPPAPAADYQRAYVAMLTWYRAMTANRDSLDHQRLINNDRQLFAQMGRAILAGQSTCGYDVWNAAWEEAFNP